MSDFLLSFDVEDWFHAHNLRPAVSRDEWEECESRVEQNTRQILDLLDDHDTKATFFVLGWVAERAPDLVREIDARGHEVASHGYNHELLTEQSTEEVRKDIHQSLDVLEELIDQRIRGYRAPSFSITEEAIDVLADLRFEYDSSSFPVSNHDRYGSLSAEGTETFVDLDNGLVEAQLPRLDLPGTEVPWAGGGYFRFLPYPIYRRGAERIGSERQFIFYLHPWEFDPDQPRFSDLPLSYRVRHYTNLAKTKERLDRLLSDFDWKPIGDVL
ncbi:XrtA system polysaccharide deacetylase [Halorussus marinus]|uniref:XrtA system polysaccharide deacetylase n=1 Tax=Halorussus marinus TaxID=2505976 RepID=UPI001ADD2939|nr:XrtA system polysaccharide deacetylase [Halorussus marinus]